jgi:hypothetical protein
VPISSVVLSSQRVEQKQAIYDAAKAKDREKEDAVNPLVQDGKKLIPSVTRVFSANRELYVYLQAYRQAAAGAAPSTQPLFAYVSFYSGGAEVFESGAIAVAPNPASRIGVTAMNFDVALSQLAAGQYDCQVTLVDPVTQKANFWRAPIVITQ